MGMCSSKGKKKNSNKPKKYKEESGPKVKEVVVPKDIDLENLEDLTGTKRLKSFKSPQGETPKKVNSMNSHSNEAHTMIDVYGTKIKNSDNTYSEGPFMYSDNSTYKGGMKNGKRDGFGECVYIDGSIYRGFWKNDKKHGNGNFGFEDGEIYCGEFFDDFAQGKGRTLF